MQTQCVNIILEGTSYSDTKCIALALSEYPRLLGKKEYQRYTAVISSKWGNFKDFPWGKDLINFDPAEEEKAMKNYRVWTRLIELQRHFNWIIDRFHVSTQQYQIQHNNYECDFQWLEDRFLKIGFHLVYIFQNDEALLKKMNSQKVANIDKKLSRVVQERDLLRQLVSKSILPNLELDISGIEKGEIVENITDWYEEVSGYTQPENQPLDKTFLPSC